MSYEYFYCLPMNLKDCIQNILFKVCWSKHIFILQLLLSCIILKICWLHLSLLNISSLYDSLYVSYLLSFNAYWFFKKVWIKKQTFFSPGSIPLKWRNMFVQILAVFSIQSHKVRLNKETEIGETQFWLLLKCSFLFPWFSRINGSIWR